MEVVQLMEATESAVKDVNELMKQLRGERFERGATLEELRNIVGNSMNAMLVAKDGERIVGVATLYGIQKVGKRTGHVEDVVVHSEYRGRGLGKELMSALVKVAREYGLESLNLTSRPSREAANKLYQGLGFELVTTNPYRLRL